MGIEFNPNVPAQGAGHAVNGSSRDRNRARPAPAIRQDRLDLSSNAMAIQQENAAASESAVRDVDVARETIAFTRKQILTNSGTSILAQGNVVSRSALSLLD